MSNTELLALQEHILKESIVCFPYPIYRKALELIFFLVPRMNRLWLTSVSNISFVIESDGDKI